MAAHSLHKLSAIHVARVSEPGMYGDGGGLWLQVSAPPTEGEPARRYWVFRYARGKRPSQKHPGKYVPTAHEMGLGSLADLSLHDARKLAAECRGQLSQGIDPIRARKAQSVMTSAEPKKVPTFKECAREYVALNKPSWKNPKHKQQWENTLTDYVEPIMGKVSVADLDTPAIVKVLLQDVPAKPGQTETRLWYARTETAKRLRGRIEAILDWAKVMGYRSGENPARWKGHLDMLLPKPSRIAKTKHHPALPYDQLPEFMQELRKQEGIAARALEFLILSTARTNEVIGAKKAELSLAQAIWTVPPEKMKGERVHRVPLSANAVEIVREMEPLNAESEFVFPGRKPKSGLTNMAMDAVVRRMHKQRPGGWRDDKGRKITVHGFRSTFRDWAAETTSYPPELAEIALSHINGDKTEAAYLRADLFEKRRRMMDDWTAYCRSDRTASAEVVPIRATAAR